MRLAKVRITNFQSVQDSNEFEIDEVTCLVGKNEAGKTALLKALYRLNPIVESHGSYTSDDYPRQSVSDYEDDVKSGRRKPANVVQATYALDSDDIDTITKIYGPRCIKDEAPTIDIYKGYSNKITFSGLDIAENEAIKHIVDDAGLPQDVLNKLCGLTVQEMIDILEKAESTEAVQKLTPTLKDISEHGILELVHGIINERLPKFLYFDEYYQLRGQENLHALMQRRSNGNLRDSDQPLLGLISLARLNLEQMVEPRSTETLIARLEAAENMLTKKVLPHWSQNRHIRMTFDIRPAQPNDPDGMNSGTNIWGRVRDTRRMVTTALGSRSRGFVWFFSFLAWYSKTRKEEENLILLLDEPGLSLHAKAQADLLRYFEKELQPHHQLIYTTHSPFMVDPKRFDRVRIVQDLSIEENPDDLTEDEQGTRVITEVLDATSDSLFPLQGALGYDIHQTLFVGPNCLIVEGVSDLLYIQTISVILQEQGKDGLNNDWTITPVGGADKVPTFVALIGAQTNLNIAVLIDYQKKDQQNMENLYKRKLIRKKNVFTYAEYVERNEADIEDMFDLAFYLKLVDEAFGASIDDSSLPQGPRIVRHLERYLTNNPLPNGAHFNHYRPAFYFSKNVSTLADELTESELIRFQRAFDALNKLL